MAGNDNAQGLSAMTGSLGILGQQRAVGPGHAGKGRESARPFLEREQLPVLTEYSLCPGHGAEHYAWINDLVLPTQPFWGDILGLLHPQLTHGGN